MNTLMKGAIGPAVKALQARLKALGFFGGEVSGAFDEPTAEAVIEFQKRNTLPPDGIAGPQVLKALKLKITDLAPTLSERVYMSLEKLSQAPADDVKAIGASQLDLLVRYYDVVLKQAEKSFRWALAAAGLGFVFFLFAVLVVLFTDKQNIGHISVIGGALIEVIAGVNFFLYGKTTTQLANFHQRLNNTQRIIIANSICESIDGDLKGETRAVLVGKIAALFNDEAEPVATGK